MKRAAVIGLGDISMVHIPALLAHPEIELVAVCDVVKENRSWVPEEIPFYTDYVEMVKAEKPDCVHICLPHYLHYPVAKELASLGVDIFCEKPLALNTEEAFAFAKLEEEYNVKICISLQNRRNETVETLKEIIDSKKYGNVVGIKGHVFWYRPKSYYDIKPWRGKLSTAGGGCMINQSVHTLDLMQYLTGDKVKSIKGSVSQILDYGIEVEDTASARLYFENGAVGMFFATVANYENHSVELHVKCENKEFLIRNSILYRIEEDGLVQIIEDARLPGTKFYYGASHSKLIAEFYEVLEGRSTTYIHPADAVMSIRLIDSIVKSSKTNKEIEL